MKMVRVIGKIARLRMVFDAIAITSELWLPLSTGNFVRDVTAITLINDGDGESVIGLSIAEAFSPNCADDMLSASIRQVNHLCSAATKGAPRNKQSRNQ